MFIQPPSLAYVREWLKEYFLLGCPDITRYNNNFIQKCYYNGNNFRYLFPNGATAFFLNVTKEWGLKLYVGIYSDYFYDESFQVEYNHKHAKKVYELGLAPPVGDIVEIGIEGFKYRGFWQGRTIPLDEIKSYDKPINYNDNFDSLLSRLSQHGYSGDMHEKNLGYYPDLNGDMVCFDFSHAV